jgi:hypothetical protein
VCQSDVELLLEIDDDEESQVAEVETEEDELRYL